MFKVNNRSTRKRCEICSKLTTETPERHQGRQPGTFIVNFENISHLFFSVSIVDFEQANFCWVFFFIFDYKVLFVCVKDKTCLRMAIPAHYFNIFGSIFGVLFCLIIKKLIVGIKTIWKSVRKFPCAA